MPTPKPTSREMLRKTLLERIGNGQLGPGERIVEARLAEEFHTSTIPVREAIRELVAVGVLQFEPHRGAWVRKVNLRETIDAMNARAAIEPLVAREAALRLKGRCEPLRRAADAVIAAAQKSDFVAFQHHNQIFHRAIFEAAGSAVLLRIWDSLAFEVRTRAILEYLTTVDPAEVAMEHNAIVDALDRGDGKRAAALLQLHSRGLVRYLKNRLDAEERPANRLATAVDPRRHSQSHVPRTRRRGS